MNKVCKAVDEKVSVISRVCRPSLILVVPSAQRCLTLQIRQNAVLSTSVVPAHFLQFLCNNLLTSKFPFVSFDCQSHSRQIKPNKAITLIVEHEQSNITHSTA
ncbi:hypothetical protein T07_12092 [Trichinella nelsoni]|uniref:Uncharacterized protein n=1 Tax=Trichinella nelsoni TaxID=6336 RepID=A0A0V0RE92_9BILA|nr:hypothetical protein T07_12092 [Trichinella nelsoni]